MEKIIDEFKEIVGEQHFSSFLEGKILKYFSGLYGIRGL